MGRGSLVVQETRDVRWSDAGCGVLVAAGCADRSPLRPRLRRQRSLQNRTSFQLRSQRFRHANGRPQTTQIFSGRADLCIVF
ncbi:MAG: hypothetical protein RLZZ436_2977 [Planctomycetota bacterium]|jgi:hypothetical protein